MTIIIIIIIILIIIKIIITHNLFYDTALSRGTFNQISVSTTTTQNTEENDNPDCVGGI